MQQVLRTKGRRDRVYTVFQLPDHQRVEGVFRGDVPRRLPFGGNMIFANTSPDDFDIPNRTAFSSVTVW